MSICHHSIMPPSPPAPQQLVGDPGGSLVPGQRGMQKVGGVGEGLLGLGPHALGSLQST